MMGKKKMMMGGGKAKKMMKGGGKTKKYMAKGGAAGGMKKKPTMIPRQLTKRLRMKRSKMKCDISIATIEFNIL